MEERLCFQSVFRNLSDKSVYNCLKIGHNNRSKVSLHKGYIEVFNIS